MKIRTNYVSNSSSSSFVIAFNDMKVIEKFKEFDGYSTFITDMNAKESHSKALNELIINIAGFISNVMYGIVESYEYEARGWEDNLDSCYNRNQQWWDIKDFFKYDEDDTKKCCDKIHEIGQDFVNKMNGREWDYQDKDVIEFEKNTRKIMDCSKEIAEKFLASDNVKGWNFKVIRYADETAEGDFMEHQFMPFVAACPSKEMIVLIQSNH